MAKKTNNRKRYTSYRVVKNGAKTIRPQFPVNTVNTNKEVESNEQRESNDKERE